MSLNEFKNLKLLYVEDEDKIRKYAMSYFNSIFDETYEAKNAFEAYEIYENQKPQIIITDIKMKNMSGLEFIKKVRQQDKNCQIIILSAFLDTKYLLDAVELNLVKYLTKPIKHEQIYPALLQCAKNIKINPADLFYFSQNSYFNRADKVLVHEFEEMKLTQKEIELLELFVLKKTGIITYLDIENAVWYDSVMSENALRLLIKKLRKKLPIGTLENVPKIGYKIRCL